MDKLSNRLITSGIDAASLSIFRICFGFLLAYEAIFYVAVGFPLTIYSPERFHFTFLGFEWVKPLPGHLMQMVFMALSCFGFMLAIGLFARLSALASCLTLLYIFLVEKSLYLNHFYLFILLCGLLAILPIERGWSIDRCFQHPEDRRDRVPAWCLNLLRLQLLIVYTYAAVAKMNVDWMNGQPIQIWLERDHPGFLSALAPIVSSHALAVLMSWAGLLFDLLAAPLLLCRRTRVPTALVLIAFHCSNAYLFNIGIFPCVMVATLSLFFPSDWPRRSRVTNWLFQDRTAEPEQPQRPHALTAFLLALFIGLQLLLPLRHYLYPGDVNWTNEGGKFSWRMKLRDVQGVARFFAVDKATGNTDEITDLIRLDANQKLKMLRDADMLQEFAIRLREKLEADGRSDFTISADVFVSVNGRELVRLIDKDVDISLERRTLHYNHWIQDRPDWR